MLVFHGTDDSVVPFSHGEALFKLSKAGPVNSGRYRQFIPLEGADHDDIALMMGDDEYLKRITNFIESSVDIRGKSIANGCE